MRRISKPFWTAFSSLEDLRIILERIPHTDKRLDRTRDSFADTLISNLSHPMSPEETSPLLKHFSVEWNWEALAEDISHERNLLLEDLLRFSRARSELTLRKDLDDKYASLEDEGGKRCCICLISLRNASPFVPNLDRVTFPELRDHLHAAGITIAD